jgi:phage terminase large subunit-like protein
VIGDDVHAWDSSELFEVVLEGEGARAQPLNILITTAGKRDEGYAWEQHEYALGVLKGEIEDDELLVAIFAADEDDDWTDPAVWAKANPNIGISPKLEFLESQCREARQLKRKENRFRQYYLNQWVGQSTRWLPMEFWDMCTRAPSERARKLFLSDPERDEKLRALAQEKGEYDPLLWKTLAEGFKARRARAWGGLDLATVSDMCALSWEFEPEIAGDPVPIIWRFFLPRETLKTLPPRTRRLYEKFIEAQALTLTPGNVADYDFIEQQILQDAKDFQVVALGIDRYNATDLASRLLNREGMPVELFGQGFVSMSGPSKDFERRVLGLGIEHGNNPVIRWMAENVAVDEDAADNIKPTKERSAGKIDGIVSAVMGRGMAMSKIPETSVYEMRGIRSI